MKKLRILFALLGLVFFFSACDNDDNPTPEKEIVKINKQHDDALLLVTFGSTWDVPHKTYENMVAAYKAEFPDKDIYLAFTSTICITRWGAKTNEYFATPDKWLQAMAKHNYKNITIQSLHVIPGQEYLLLKNKYVAEFKKAEPEISVSLGDALLTSDQDIQEVGDILIGAFKSRLDKGEVVAFMGHGNPESEYDNANASYVKIQDYMHKKYGKTMLVGTVDYEPMLIAKILEQMKKEVKTGSVVNLTPLMSIAGDHANNDMAGDIDTQAADDEQSWKIQMRKAGYKIEKHNCILKGLGDYPEIVNVWIRHTKEAK